MTRTGSKPDIAALREEIGQTRTELGETVHELAARVDVPSRMRAMAGRTATRARRSPAPWLLLAAAAGYVAVAVELSIRRRGRRR